MRPNEQTANVDTQASSHKEQTMSSVTLGFSDTIKYLELSTTKPEHVEVLAKNNGYKPGEVDTLTYAKALAAIGRLVVPANQHPVTFETRVWLESELTIANEKIDAAKTKPTKNKWIGRRNELNTLIREIPAVALENWEQRRKWDEESLEGALRKMIDDGAKARKAMAEELTESVSSALSIMEWQDSRVETMAMERLALRAMTLVDEHGWNVVEAVRDVLEGVETRLLDNALRGDSTGHGFRLVANADRNAHRVFRDTVRWYLH